MAKWKLTSTYLYYYCGMFSHCGSLSIAVRVSVDVLLARRRQPHFRITELCMFMNELCFCHGGRVTDDVLPRTLVLNCCLKVMK